MLGINWIRFDFFIIRQIISLRIVNCRWWRLKDSALWAVRFNHWRVIVVRIQSLNWENGTFRWFWFHLKHLLFWKIGFQNKATSFPRSRTTQFLRLPPTGCMRHPALHSGAAAFWVDMFFHQLPTPICFQKRITEIGSDLYFVFITHPRHPTAHARDKPSFFLDTCHWTPWRVWLWTVWGVTCQITVRGTHVNPKLNSHMTKSGQIWLAKKERTALTQTHKLIFDSTKKKQCADSDSPAQKWLDKIKK